MRQTLGVFWEMTKETCGIASMAEMTTYCFGDKATL